MITSAVDGGSYGTTASAVSSLSLERPMVLVCPNKTSETEAAILEAAVFCVNIPVDGQQDVAYQFACKADKFAGSATPTAWTASRSCRDAGAPGVPGRRDP